MKDLIVHGDQAYTPAEWRERLADLALNRRYQARYRAAHPERKAYNREWMRAYREGFYLRRVVVGSLHHLSCTGATKRTGCSCRKIEVLA